MSDRAANAAGSPAASVATHPANEMRYVLRLYVTGSTARSIRAIRNIQAICAKHLQGQYELEVIDIYQTPQAAIDAQIIAVPTLIRISPAPIRRAVGDLSDEDRVLSALDIVLAETHG